MKMGSSQQYCLRWNNHRSNLLTVFDQLLQNEAFTDVTIACDGGTSVKCHKMVLAACSPYFQCLFTELPCRHPVVILKDVKYSEMKAILEYMYKGEVNVAHDQLAALLKVAEALRVKGLVEENGTTGKPEPDQTDRRDSSSPPIIGTSTAASSSVPHSSISPTHSTHGNGESHPSPGYGKPYHFNRSLPDRGRSGGIPMWNVPHPAPTPSVVPHAAATAAAMMNCYEAASYDMSPLRRKKLQSLMMTRDTPILRTVLGQGHVDSSQTMPLICHPDTPERSLHFNGSLPESDRSLKAEPCEDAPSPYTDISMHDEETSPSDKANKSLPTSSPSDNRGVSSGIATYVPQQKPEWKRYKQYTRNDILSAIDAVRTGMSALQAARKFGVPSRTLYDKVKKLGITTSRPFKKGSNGGNGPVFPYPMAMFACKQDNEDPVPSHPSGPMLEPMFLQHALERGKSGDYGEREALMALATAHAQQASQGSGSTHNSSPEYKWPGSMTPSPNDNAMDDEDQVEDLSVNRKETHQSQHPTGSVIVPPMTHLSLKSDDERGSRFNEVERNPFAHRDMKEDVDRGRLTHLREVKDDERGHLTNIRDDGRLTHLRDPKDDERGRVSLRDLNDDDRARLAHLRDLKDEERARMALLRDIKDEERARVTHLREDDDRGRLTLLRDVKDEASGRHAIRDLNEDDRSRLSLKDDDRVDGGEPRE